MSQKTIRCRLVASETTRQAIWHLMAERNTPLINQALHQVPQYPDFLTWQRRGTLPDVVAKKLIDALKPYPRFSDQPVWYYISAQKQVTYTRRVEYLY